LVEAGTVTERIGLTPALACVVAGMLALFLVPGRLFVPVTFVATSVMMLAAYLVGAKGPRASLAAVLTGLGSAALLYAVFYGGNLAISTLGIPGLASSSETSVYSLIASPSNPLVLQVGVLAFDAAGYEAFFRGTLQARLERRLGLWAAPTVALLDAGIHIATLNPLWVATTFVADLTWGLTFHYGRDLSASLTSHFVWDLVIFVIRPIR